MDRYVSVDRIDGGGYADVYKAHDTVDNLLVALKVLRDCRPENVRRFACERAMLTAYSNNPYVIKLLDSDLTGTTN